MQLDEEAIFHLAKRIPALEDRETYLDQVCAGDQSLRNRVVDLLRAKERLGVFCELLHGYLLCAKTDAANVFNDRAVASTVDINHKTLVRRIQRCDVVCPIKCP